MWRGLGQNCWCCNLRQVDNNNEICVYRCKAMTRNISPCMTVTVQEAMFSSSRENATLDSAIVSLLGYISIYIYISWRVQQYTCRAHSTCT